jgi:hypothetical protein
VGQQYRDAFSTFVAQCPDHIDRDRWQQAVEDGQRFLMAWGAEAQAFGWTAPQLLGLHPVPEQPAASYSRLGRLDDMGFLWLLRGRPIIALTAAEAVIRCASGASLTCRRRIEPAPAEIANAATTIHDAKGRAA